jgi:pyruvate formate lyase activating enzyme
MHPAILWRPVKNLDIQCEACSHFCYLKEGEKGKCGVRINQKGRLYTLVKDKIAALNLDPVEKKPLFHFLPGSKTLSLATMGCNFACIFCQNHSLSQPPKKDGTILGENISADSILQLAKEEGALSVSYTYSEPTIFIELVLEVSRKAQVEGIKNILVTNGYQSPKALEELGPYIQAANVDLKSFAECFYLEYCQASLKTVLNNLEHMKKLGWWLEITTLVITELNDSPQELKNIARYIQNYLGKETPWHISRYHPSYKLNNPPTPLNTLEKAYEIGKEVGLDYVYLGNVPGHMSESTYCPACGKVVIARRGFTLLEINLKEGKCAFCDYKIAGDFSNLN